MAELGSGNGTSYPAALDVDNSVEADSSTTARADVPNDLAAAVIAVQTELGTDPAGTQTNVKTFLQTEHATNGTHSNITANNLTLAKTLIQKVGADVASASTLAVNIDGNIFDVTGTTGITAMASKGVGSVIVLQFDGIVTLTDDNDDLKLGGSNITTAAGQVLTFYEYASAKWRLIANSITSPVTATSTTTFTNKSIDSDNNTITNIVNADIKASAAIAPEKLGAGAVVQVVSTTLTTNFSTASTSFTDLTGMSVAITPKSSSNKVLVIFHTNVGRTSNFRVAFRLVRGSTAIGVGTSVSSRHACTVMSYVGNADSDSHHHPVSGNFLDSPSTTSSTTYKLQLLNTVSQTAYINRSELDTNSTATGRSASTITVMEIAG